MRQGRDQSGRGQDRVLGEPLRRWAGSRRIGAHLAGLSSVLALVACGGGGSTESGTAPTVKPAQVLARMSAQGQGAPCANGGHLLQTGLDLNGNGVLDNDEVSSTQYVCHGSPGAPGLQALLELQPEAPGTSCAAGGQRISSGLDLNGNKQLEPAEVSATAYACHGGDGRPGLQALLSIDEEPAGARCPAGGSRLASGLDRNGNGVLDADEVMSTSHLCNGQGASSPSAGAPRLLLSMSDEAAGAICSHGGKRIDTGLDANGNGLLDAQEISSTQRVCHGADGSNGANGSNGGNGSNGSNGLNSLLTLSAEPAGANCPQGGKKLSSGLDANGNQLLEAAEVSSSSYVCHGGSGLSSLMSMSNEAAGANCSHGGKKINSGLDSNGNGLLDAAEVTASSYVCNGATGGTGPAGLQSLLDIVNEAPGAHCAAGGKRVNSGLDANANGVLEVGEIAASSYVCNGTNGSNGGNGLASLLTIVDELAGANCAAGGKKVSSGLDANGNGALDAGEIGSTAYVCHGAASQEISYQWVGGVSATMSSNKGYIVGSVDEVLLSLPAAPAVGDRVAVTGAGSGGWRIGQNAGQFIDATALGARGQDWSLRTGITNVSAMASSANGLRLAASGYVMANLVYLSDDGGLNWFTRPSPTLMRLAMSTDGSRLFGSVDNGQLYTSSDRGQTWVARESARSWYTVSSSADGMVLLAGGPSLQLYVSTDGGASWTARETGRQWYSSAVSADGRVMLAGDFNGQLYVSSDGGVNWDARGPSKAWRGVAMSADGRTMLAAPMADYVHVSTDGGLNWEARGNFQGWFRASVSADGQKMLATADSGSPIMSMDRGLSWTTPAGAGGVFWTQGVLSGDGKRLLASRATEVVAVAEGRSTAGVAGSLAGEGGAAVMLQYVGGGRWLALNGSGALTAQ